MYRLRTLGAIDLRDAAGEPVAALLQQPRRLALLAYLACARDGFLRRDHLLTLFWPELDEARGRAALSQALHVIRRSLDASLIVTRGTEEVGIDRDQLETDASEFARLGVDRRWEEADRLYRGDFLPAFHLDEAPGFERWMEETRESLRTRAQRAAEGLLVQEETAGRVAGAIRWARRLVELDPIDESSTRRLIQLLARTGDRAGAIRAYEELADRLTRELELTPHPETTALVERLRTAAPATLPPIAPAPASGSAVAAPIPEPPSAPMPAPVVEPQPVPAGNRWRWRLSALLLVALAGVVAWRGILRSHPAEQPRVAVFPFTIRGDTSLAYLGDGMVDLVSTKLEAIGQVRTVDPGTLLARLEREGGRGDDPAELAGVATSLDADLFVVGRITGIGPRIAISLGLYNARGERQALVTSEATDQRTLPLAVDRAITDLVASRWSTPAERLERLAVGSTGSAAALRAYLDGARYFRAGRYTEARDAFRAAIAADSLYAIAWYRLSTSGAWVGNDDDYWNGARRAAELADRLGDHDRTLVRAHWAYVRGSVAESERLYRRLVSEYPDDAEAWYQLGEVLFHTGAQRGLSLEGAGAAFTRAEALIGGSAEALGHLISLAVISRDVVAADTLLPRLLALYPEGEPRRLYQRLAVAVLHDNKAVRRGIMAELPREATILWIAGQVVGTYTDDLETVDTLGAWMVAPGNPAEMRELGMLLQIDARLGGGRWEEARALAVRLGESNPALGSELVARCDAAPWLMLTREERDRSLAEVARWAPIPPSAGVAPTGIGPGLHPAIGEYYRVAIGADRGDSATASAALLALERMGAGDSLVRQSGLLVAARAVAQLARGDSAAALRGLETLTAPEMDLRLPGTVGAPSRYLRAELLRARGRPADALAWYRSFRVIFEGDLPYRGPALLGEAQALEAAGHPEAARKRYEAFLDLWARSDPRFEPLLARARERAASLGRTEVR